MFVFLISLTLFYSPFTEEGYRLYIISLRPIGAVGIPMPNKETVSIADAFVRQFILRFGIPETIATDRGIEFISNGTDLSFNNGDLLLDEDSNVYDTLFGNIGMADLFLKDPSNTAPKPAPHSMPAADDDTPDEPDLEIADVFGLLRTNLTNQTFDVLDFFMINEKYSNFTKEYKNNNKKKVKNFTRRSYVDPDDSYYGEDIEDVKQEQLQMALVQFTMHCRYEVGKALSQRDFIRNDKRYKLGYLFNRMRRLKTEQLKMVGMAFQQNKTYYRHVYGLMRVYERVVHFDVDMRDTANIIKALYRTEAPYDTIMEPRKRRRDRNETNTTTEIPPK